MRPQTAPQRKARQRKLIPTRSTTVGSRTSPARNLPSPNRDRKGMNLSNDTRELECRLTKSAVVGKRPADWPDIPELDPSSVQRLFGLPHPAMALIRPKGCRSAPSFLH